MLEQGSGDLECEEGVAVRRAFDPEQVRSGEGVTEPLPDQLVQRPEAERAEAERGVARAGSEIRETARRQHPHPLRAEAVLRELEHGAALGVEPLSIVDGDDDGPCVGELPEEGQERDADRPAIGRRAFCCRAQQRDVQCAALGLGQPGELLGLHGREEVAERGERQTRLGRGRAAAQHQPTVRPCAAKRFLPQRRLADARFAFQREHGEPVRDTVQELVDRDKFFRAPEQRP